MSELRRLQLLVELSRRGTITAVADAHSYSSSAVSQQLAALERDIGTPLLQPDGRRVKFTAAGRALLDRAGAVLGEWERARSAALQWSDSLTGKLEIAAFQTAYLALIPGAVDALRAEHPRLDLRVMQAEPETAIPAILAHELDAAIVERFPGGNESLGRELARTLALTDPLALAVPLAGGGGVVRLEDLAGSAFVLEQRGSHSRAWAERMCRSAGFEPRVIFESSDMLVQLELVRQNRAVAFMPTLMPSRFLEGVRMVQLPGEARAIDIVTREGNRDDPAIVALRDALDAAVLALP